MLTFHSGYNTFSDSSQRKKAAIKIKLSEMENGLVKVHHSHLETGLQAGEPWQASREMC